MISCDFDCKWLKLAFFIWKTSLSSDLWQVLDVRRFAFFICLICIQFNEDVFSFVMNFNCDCYYYWLWLSWCLSNSKEKYFFDSPLISIAITCDYQSLRSFWYFWICFFLHFSWNSIVSSIVILTIIRTICFYYLHLS